MTPSKRHLAAFIAGLASLTWIGVSAAQDEPELDDTVEETGTEDEIETTVDEPVDETTDAELEDEGTGEHPLNHGFYVSEATKTCPESGKERGECISEVAKGDLGKSHADEESEDSEAEEADDESDDESSEQGAEESDGDEGTTDERSPGHGKGHAKD